MIYVMDASALLALSHGERGYEVVEDFIQTQECVVSSVNMAEVGSKLVDKGLTEEDLPRILNQYQVGIIDFSAEQAIRSAAIRNLTRSSGLSLGDRACFALAQLMEGCVVTTDRVWSNVEDVLGVKVIQIRK